MENEIIPVENIQSKIYEIRGLKVMLDRDLAIIYETETRTLKQAVKRNLERFPDDFMFELTEKEVDLMVSQSVIPSRSYFGGALPFAFTEQGIAMLSSVLKSKTAIMANIQIMRAFIKNKHFFNELNELKKHINILENKYDKQFQAVFNAIKELITIKEKPKRPMGFNTKS